MNALPRASSGSTFGGLALPEPVCTAAARYTRRAGDAAAFTGVALPFAADAQTKGGLQVRGKTDFCGRGHFVSHVSAEIIAMEEIQKPFWRVRMDSGASAPRQRTKSMEDELMSKPIKAWHVALIASAMAISLSTVLHARDPGINQPGAAGNVQRDPGVNQPGAAGNVGAPGVGRDPGINQPGAAGNVGGPVPGRDPGINQPGAAGNVGSPGVGNDPGINQPGEAGNRPRIRR